MSCLDFRAVAEHSNELSSSHFLTLMFFVVAVHHQIPLATIWDMHQQNYEYMCVCVYVYFIKQCASFQTYQLYQHCRDTLWSGMLLSIVALLGYSVPILRSGTAGMLCVWARQGYSAVAEFCAEGFLP